MQSVQQQACRRRTSCLASWFRLVNWVAGSRPTSTSYCLLSPFVPCTRVAGPPPCATLLFEAGCWAVPARSASPWASCSAYKQLVVIASRFHAILTVDGYQLRFRTPPIIIKSPPPPSSLSPLLSIISQPLISPPLQLSSQPSPFPPISPFAVSCLSLFGLHRPTQGTTLSLSNCSGQQHLPPKCLPRLLSPSAS